MHVDVNDTRLWFDVDGAALRPADAAMRAVPTLVLVHGGPGSYDHSYFKPHFDALRAVAQIVYLDLRDHGRSGRTDPAQWRLEACADDLRAFCDALGIDRPVVLGHSMGGFVAMLYGARHADHAGGLILVGTMARFDLERIVGGFRAAAGDTVAALARRDYGGDPIPVEEWAQVFAAFGPNVPDALALARRIRNADVGTHGMARMRALDIVSLLASIRAPTLVCVGDRDPVTPVAASEEIVRAMPPGTGRIEVLAGAGHFPWLDDPERFRALVTAFVGSVAAGQAA